MKTNNLFDLWLKYLTAFLIIAIPLFPKFPFIKISGTYVSIRLEDLILAAAGITAAIFIAKNFRLMLKDRLNYAVLLFIGVGAVSLLSAIFLTQTVDPKIGILHLVRRIEYIVPFYLGMAAIMTNRNNLPFFLKVLLIVVLFVSVYGFGQKYYDWPVIITQNEEYSTGIALRYLPGGHLNSTFAGHYDLGSFLVMVLPIFLSLIFLVKKSKLIYFLLPVLMGGYWLLANTASRISLVALIMASAFSLVLIRKKRFIPIVFICIMFFAGTSANLLSRYERIIEVTTKKILPSNLLNFYYSPVMAASDTGSLPGRVVEKASPTPTPVFEDRSSNIRLNVEWPRAIRALTKNPFLGTGYSSITLATDNDYLRVLGETGLLGALSFILLFGSVFLEVIRKSPLATAYDGWELALIAGFAGMGPGIMLNAVFIDIFEASKFAIMFWLLAGFAVGVSRLNKHDEAK